MMRPNLITAALLAAACLLASPPGQSLASEAGLASERGPVVAQEAAPGRAPTAVNPSPLTIDPDLAIFTAIVFLVLLAILGKFAWRPIIEGLDKRESAIAAQIDEARRSAEAAQQSLRQYEARLASAQDEVGKMLAAARQHAESAKEQIVGEARTAAERQRQRAVADIEAAKNAALSEVAEKSADLAMNLAGKIVRRELKREDHARLIQDSLERFPGRN